MCFLWNAWMFSVFIQLLRTKYDSFWNCIELLLKWTAEIIYLQNLLTTLLEFFFWLRTLPTTTKYYYLFFIISIIYIFCLVQNMLFYNFNQVYFFNCISFTMWEYIQEGGEDWCHVIWCGASSISIRKVSMGVSPISLKKKRCSRHFRPMERRAGRRSSSLANL